MTTRELNRHIEFLLSELNRLENNHRSELNRLENNHRSELNRLENNHNRLEQCYKNHISHMEIEILTLRGLIQAGNIGPAQQMYAEIPSTQDNSNSNLQGRNNTNLPPQAQVYNGQVPEEGFYSPNQRGVGVGMPINVSNTVNPNWNANPGSYQTTSDFWLPSVAQGRIPFPPEGRNLPSSNAIQMNNQNSFGQSTATNLQTQNLRLSDGNNVSFRLQYSYQRSMTVQRAHRGYR